MWSFSYRKLLWACTAVVAFGAAAGAEAATANFQGNCSWNGGMTQFTCSFDALRPAGSPSSCPGSFIWKYSWDYGDGTSSGLTGNSTVSHTYPSSVVNPTVTLTVLCWDGNSPTKARVINHPFGVPGGININGTWN
jgi:hypothetical protein